MLVPLTSERNKSAGRHLYQKIDTTGRSNRLFGFICPRQSGYDMALEISDGRGGLIDTIPLGSMLESAGYDWTSRNLDNIFIRINKEHIGLSVAITDWKTGEIKEFIL